MFSCIHVQLLMHGVANESDVIEVVGSNACVIFCFSEFFRSRCRKHKELSRRWAGLTARLPCASTSCTTQNASHRRSQKKDRLIPLEKRESLVFPLGSLWPLATNLKRFINFENKFIKLKIFIDFEKKSPIMKKNINFGK